jgi:hypothetical protein
MTHNLSTVWLALFYLTVTALFSGLDKNVEFVDSFFTKRSTNLQRQLNLLINMYGEIGSAQLDFHELEELVCSFQITLILGRRSDGIALAVAEAFMLCGCE